MMHDFVVALKACCVTFVMCAVAYPAVVWGVAELVFPFQAEGSLIYDSDGRTVVGSALVAQRFDSDRYFHPRPSAADYKADAASGSNLGTKNPDLRKLVAARSAALGATTQHPVPVDLVTASGSGLDPDISLPSALFQASRVAVARGLPNDKVQALIDGQTNRSGTILGAPPRVNVLLLNLALDSEHGVSQ
jgi:potassium-transporting ATPase KdpC subunit